MSVAAIQQFPPHRVVEPDGTPLAAGVLTELVASNLDEVRQAKLARSCR